MSDRNSSIIRFFAGAAIAVDSAALSYWLLVSRDDFSGGAAVSLFTLGIVVALIVSYSSSISQINALGAEIKFNRLSIKADETLKSLDQGRMYLYSTLITLTLKRPGSLQDDRKPDPRIEEFLNLLVKISVQGLEEDLSMEIALGAKQLLDGQLGSLVEQIPKEDFANLSSERDYHGQLRVAEEWLAANQYNSDKQEEIEAVREKVASMRMLLEAYKRAVSEIPKAHAEGFPSSSK